MTNGCFWVFRECLEGRQIISEAPQANPAQENQFFLASNLPAETRVVAFLACLLLEEVGSKMTCKLSVQVWRLDFWVWKNWKTSNIHWPVVIFSVNILLCTWKIKLLMKMHCHKAVLSAFVSKGTVFNSALVMLYERFEMIQILLLSHLFEHSLQKCQRWCAPSWEDAAGGAVIMAVQRMADLSSIAFWDQKYSTVLHWNKPKVFHFIFSRRMECQQSVPLGLKMLTFSIAPCPCTSSLKHTVTYVYFFRTRGHPGSRQ